MQTHGNLKQVELVPKTHTYFYKHCTLIQTQAFQCHAPHTAHCDTSANSAEEKKRKIAYLQKQQEAQGN